MGKKLSITEQGKSIQAVNAYHRKAGDEYVYQTQVAVKDKNGQVIQWFEDMPISINPDSNWTNVNINWEERGLINYQVLNLYGYYSTAFVKMSFDDENLIIKSSDSDKIVYIALPN